MQDGTLLIRNAMASTFARFGKGAFVGVFLPLACKMQLTAVRCLTASSVHLLKRPTFDGPQLPKRPPNAYTLFIMDNMELARLPDSGRLDVKKLGEMWKSLAQPQREEYRAKYEEQKKIYKDKVDEFMAGLGGKEEQDAYLNSLADYRAKRRAYLKHFRLKKLGLVKPRKISAHSVFAGERLKEAGVPGLNTQLIKEIPSMWKALSDGEKQRYQKMAEERYTTRIAEYEERLKKAQKEGKVPPEEPKKSKSKKATKTKKSSTPAKKKATKKSALAKSKKTPTKRKKQTAKKSATSTKSAKSAKLDDDADQWISSDDED